MPVGAVVGAASLASAGIGAWAAGKASDAQSKAAQQSLDFQKQVFAQNQANVSPFINFGKGAVSSLADLYGLGPQGAGGVKGGWDEFTKLPAYQFPYEQGLRALNFQLNAQGRQQSGAQARASQQFGQGLASQYLMSNYVNPLTQFAQMGSGAAGSLAGVNTQGAGQIGNTNMGLGQAQASGYVGAANAVSGGLGNLALYSMVARNGQNNQNTGNPNPSSYQMPAGMGASSVQYNG